MKISISLAALCVLILQFFTVETAYAQCRDPWVTKAVTEVTNHPPNGEGDEGDCDPKKYGEGSWSSYEDLVGKVKTYFSKELFSSISEDNYEKVKAALTNKTFVSASDESGNLPIHIAALHDNIKICEFLIDSGADVNAKSRDGSTPITMLSQPELATSKHWQLIKKLVDRGASVNLKGVNGRTVIDQGGPLYNIQFLLSKGAHLNDATINSCIRQGHIDSVKYLMSKGIKLKSNASHTELLRMAIASGNQDMVKLMISKGEKVRLNKSRILYSPVYIACLGEDSYKRKIAMITLLLSLGADINARDGDKTPLQETIARNEFEVFQFLLAHGADVNAVDYSGRTSTNYTIAYERDRMRQLIETKQTNVAKDVVSRQRALIGKWKLASEQTTFEFLQGNTVSINSGIADYRLLGPSSIRIDGRLGSLFWKIRYFSKKEMVFEDQYGKIQLLSRLP